MAAAAAEAAGAGTAGAAEVKVAAGTFAGLMAACLPARWSLATGCGSGGRQALERADA